MSLSLLMLKFTIPALILCLTSLLTADEDPAQPANPMQELLQDRDGQISKIAEAVLGKNGGDRLFYFPTNDQPFTPAKYGKKYGDTDIITMKLDLGKQTLEYFINEESQGIAVHDVIKDNDIYYRFAISMYDQADSVQLLDFEQF